MTTKFKYNLDSLEWDSDHLRNKEGVYCYCGLDYTNKDTMLSCDSCRQLFHWDCVNCLRDEKPLYGDIHYSFTCSVCNPKSEETYTRHTLSWVQVIYLVLYHLIHNNPDKKYFRWRENICATIDEHWDTLLPGKAKTATWHNTVAGCLSTHQTTFKSGFDDTQQSGNWTLHEVVEPAKANFKPAIKSSHGERQRRTKKSNAVGSEAAQEILKALDDGSGSGAGSGGRTKKRQSGRRRVSYSDSGSSSDEGSGRKRQRRRPNAKILENDTDLMQSFAVFQQLEQQNRGRTPKREEDEEVVEASGSVSVPSSSKAVSEDDVTSQMDDDNSDVESVSVSSSLSTVSTDSEMVEMLSSPKIPLEPTNDVRLFPSDNDHLEIMSDRAQWELMAKIVSSRVQVSRPVYRLGRRLNLRRTKRGLGLPVFDIDRAVAQYMNKQKEWTVCPSHRKIDKEAYEKVMGEPYPERQPIQPGGDRTAEKRPLEKRKAMTPYANSFASRLMGRAVMKDNLTWTESKVSPYNGRILRPFIWRDWESPSLAGTCPKQQQQQMADMEDDCELSEDAQKIIAYRDQSRMILPMLGVHRDIKQGNHRLLPKPLNAFTETGSIDYVYFQARHLRQVNELLCRTFWPNIDMRDSLQYPEFSVIALYKRNVIGCAFLTPDAYLSYIAVSAGWEGAGVARYMLYHLVQQLPTRDITLHVSVSNLAMVFYQKFGFKPERYVVDFYKHYLPESSRLCCNAFFMRLRRY